jgi:hypothetical protein
MFRICCCGGALMSTHNVSRVAKTLRSIHTSVHLQEFLARERIDAIEWKHGCLLSSVADNKKARVLRA